MSERERILLRKSYEKNSTHLMRDKDQKTDAIPGLAFQNLALSIIYSDRQLSIDKPLGVGRSGAVEMK